MLRIKDLLFWGVAIVNNSAMNIYPVYLLEK